MSMTKKLDITFPPPLRSYLPIAIISSIITANTRNEDWILNNFIQLFIPEGRNKLESFPFQDFMYFDQSLIRVNRVILKEDELNAEQLLSSILYNLEIGNYIVLYADESRLKGVRHYQRAPILHSQFIFGYNNSKQIFYVMNFLKSTSDFGIIEISYMELINAFICHDVEKSIRNFGELHKMYAITPTVKKDSFYNLGINREYIMNYLYQYFHGINSSEYTAYFTGGLDGAWGVNIYSKILGYIEKCESYIDRRMFYVLNEHKIYMRKRFEYLQLWDLAKQYDEIIHISTVLKNLCLQYNCRPSNKTKSFIRNKSAQLYKLEKYLGSQIEYK